MTDALTLEDMSPGLFKVVERAQREPEGRFHSLAHLIGRRRFATGDNSRNSALLSVITLGEGWHNNHHRFPGATRQGFYWWEFDPTYYALKLLARLGIVWNLRPVPARVLAEGRSR